MEAAEDLLSLCFELDREKPNVFRIQQLCQRQPGLIGDDMELRRRVWSLLLLPRSEVSAAPAAFVASMSNPRLRMTTSISIGELSPDTVSTAVAAEEEDEEETCMEQQVLEADIGRTRSEVSEFRTPLWRESLQEILRAFCIEHRVQYKQGMNELMAVFMHVSPPPGGCFLSQRLFAAFLYKYLERFFYRDESSFLFKAFRMFHLLMMHIDPKLGVHLFECSVLPELYAAPWLLTAFARSTPLPVVLRLWDVLIAVDDPAFLFFFALCLIRTMRKELMKCEANLMPEIISKLRIQDVHVIDKLIVEAFIFYRLVPRCFLRALRVCCVSSSSAIAGVSSSFHVAGAAHATSNNSRSNSGNININITGDDDGTSSSSGQGSYSSSSYSSSSSSSLPKWSRHDDTMAKQAVRCCVMMNATEMAHKVIEQWTDKGSSDNNIYSRDTTSSSSINRDISAASYLNGDHSVDVLRHIQELSHKNAHISDLKDLGEIRRTVILDVRLSDDVRGEDGGFIEGSLRMDPNLLGQPEALAAWLGQLDSLLGHNICILDNASSTNSGLALWRRLLLGEGDGDQTGSYKNNYITMHQSIFARDSDSPFYHLENEVLQEDAQRMGTHVAVALMKKGFSFVSLLDGSFQDLRSAIVSIRGSAAGIVRKFHQSGGLLGSQVVSLADLIVGADPVMMSLIVGEQTANAMTTTSTITSSSSSTTSTEEPGVTDDSMKREHISPLDEAAAERTRKAMSIAKLLGHHHMVQLLEAKLHALDDK